MTDTLNIICFGDSLVFGYNEYYENKWTTLLEKHTGYSIVNRGISGQTTGDMLKRYKRQVIKRSPDYMILIGGYNDIFQSYSIDTAIGNLDYMIRTALGSGISVIMTVPTPIAYPFDPPYWANELDLERVIPLTRIMCDEIRDLYNTIKKDLPTCPGTALGLADLESAFLSLPDLRECFLDEFHQNASGHKVIYNEMLRLLP